MSSRSSSNDPPTTARNHHHEPQQQQPIVLIQRVAMALVLGVVLFPVLELARTVGGTTSLFGLRAASSGDIATTLTTTIPTNGLNPRTTTTTTRTTTTQEFSNEPPRRLQLQGPWFIIPLQQEFQIAKAKYLQQLKAEYGTEFASLLVQTTTTTTPENGTNVFQATSLSWDRLTRKVALKILQTQLFQPQPSQPSSQPPPPPFSFVWATGGHSAAAGHGNLRNESYTAVLQAKARPLFQAVQLHFVARPYAMGGTSCGNEINTCLPAIFGTEIDVLSWDYGMTTGRDYGKVELFFHRAALLPNRPALIGLFLAHRQSILEQMEAWGPAVFSMNAESVLAQIPDTADQPVSTSIMDDWGNSMMMTMMPPNLRSFVCHGEIEKGNPTCADEKYTNLPDPKDPCQNRQGKVSWHPGWKWHALYGNLLTLFWMQILDDALDYMAQRGSDPRALLISLQRQEEEEFAPMMQSRNVSRLQHIDPDLQTIPDIPPQVIYWNRNYCHTARLPSEIRYRGILTDNVTNWPSTTIITNDDDDSYYENYDRGSELRSVLYTGHDVMPLTWDRKLYQGACKNYKLADLDHADFFLVNSKQWSKVVLPNPSEVAAYGTTEQKPLVGYIQICLASCGWGCPSDVVAHKDLAAANGTAMRTKVSMTVNGVSVEEWTPFADCAFLKHRGGHQWTANSNGQFEIRAKTLTWPDYVRISAFVLW
ncbi:hypothetical protein ACA910_014761 [Epithemia clementina (nom. ined.)]